MWQLWQRFKPLSSTLAISSSLDACKSEVTENLFTFHSGSSPKCHQGKWKVLLLATKTNEPHVISQSVYFCNTRMRSKHSGWLMRISCSYYQLMTNMRGLNWTYGWYKKMIKTALAAVVTGVYLQLQCVYRAVGGYFIFQLL